MFCCWWPCWGRNSCWWNRGTRRDRKMRERCSTSRNWSFSVCGSSPEKWQSPEWRNRSLWGWVVSQCLPLGFLPCSRNGRRSSACPCLKQSLFENIKFAQFYSEHIQLKWRRFIWSVSMSAVAVDWYEINASITGLTRDEYLITAIVFPQIFKSNPKLFLGF